MLRTRTLLSLLVLALLAAPVYAAGAVASNEPTLAEKSSPPGPSELDASAIWSTTQICTFGFPAEVQGYRVTCSGATFLDVRVSDCCIPGDHWQAKVKAWDAFPNTAVTTSPGPVILFGVPGRVYNNGSQPLRAYVECTYLHGVNVFAASSYVNLSSDAACTVTADPLRARIDRSP